ncbi:hypothetical protein [Streptomyces sp. NPDC006855]|uniref:hypothetical protein n=1 Tax=Streptomyces sp. NPDC006855 TaxID=3364765 RepID=UPI0036ABD63D
MLQLPAPAVHTPAAVVLAPALTVQTSAVMVVVPALSVRAPAITLQFGTTGAGTAGGGARACRQSDLGLWIMVW